jgi:hypothetical protein
MPDDGSTDCFTGTLAKLPWAAAKSLARVSRSATTFPRHLVPCCQRRHARPHPSLAIRRLRK